jgi:hypothetical protein
MVVADFSDADWRLAASNSNSSEAAAFARFERSFAAVPTSSESITIRTFTT